MPARLVPPEEQRGSKAAVGNARGITILEDCVYNPRWWATGPELEAHAESGPDGEAPVPPSTFTWNDGADRGLVLYFGVRRNTLALTADTKFFALDAFEPASKRVEALVLRGASDDFNLRVPPRWRSAMVPQRFTGPATPTRSALQRLGGDVVRCEGRSMAAQ
ncbi:hypothetical protein [Glycomyces arizonensis]|uniref:hypothetical protein n=1 Tax=Glycomyces arizonensis TaxID=256035 RepID=UPI0004164EB1|nr:hypothetical protein [Glycomyces arizonensis]